MYFIAVQQLLITEEEKTRERESIEENVKDFD
jgi:hypothetical protein